MMTGAEATAFEPTTQLSTIVEEERGESSTAFGSSNSPSLAAAAPAFAPTSPLSKCSSSSFSRLSTCPLGNVANVTEQETNEDATDAHAQPFTPATVQPVPAVVGTESESSSHSPST
jgi:hypothetical protein